jgi:acyl-CoA oxidase
MFIPAIMGQGTVEQQNKWLPRALNLEIIGTYAQVKKRTS